MNFVKNLAHQPKNAKIEIEIDQRYYVTIV